MLEIFLAVLAALFFAAALILQKYCLNHVRHISIKNLIKKKLYSVSLLFSLVGILLYTVALKYGSISLVQPILSLTIIFPVIVGWFFFNEKMGGRWVFIIIISAGVLLLSL